MNVFLHVGKGAKTLTKLPSMLALVAAISLLTACASQPIDTNDELAQAQEKLVCRSEKRTGTNLPKSYCRRAQEWEIIDRKQHTDASEVSRQMSELGGVKDARNSGAGAGAFTGDPVKVVGGN